MVRILISFGFICLIIFGSLSCEENKANTETAPEMTDKNEIEKSGIVVPVEVMIAKREVVSQDIPFTGVLQPIDAVDIISETSGKTVKINKNLGDYVSIKDTLAFIDDRVPNSQFRQAKAQVLSAANNLDIAKLNLSSDKELFASGDISKLEYENSVLAVKTAEANHLSALASLSLAEKAYKDTRIMSPISGVISRKYIDPGTMVSNGMPMFRVVNLNTLKMEIGVPQRLINSISVGSLADIVISALKHKPVSGTVRFISPQADEQTGTFLVEIHITNDKQNSIRAGMTARINLAVTDPSAQITVPDYALISQNGNNSIYKIQNSKAVLSEVSVQQSIGSRVIIESGISEGDTVVVVGMKNLGINTPVFIEAVN